MRHLLPALALLLAACAAPPPAAVPETAPAPARSSAAPAEPAAPAALEQAPSTLSVRHFGGMRLEGTEFLLGDVLEENASYTRHAISYRSNGLLISGILNTPKGEGPFPLIVLNHGYISPAVYTSGRGLRREQDYLARQGFAVVHPDYRGHAGSDPSPDRSGVYDAGLEYSMDSANAILALREAKLPRIHAERAAMLGHSLGGGVSLNIAAGRPDLIDALILYAPVHSDAWENFLRWRDEGEDGQATRAAMGTREENPEAWDALSSLTHLQEISVSVLLFHGTQDESVPKAWSDFLAERLRSLGKEVTYVEYEGEKHEFIPRWNDFMEKTTAFLRANLSA